jgi:D-amino-acid dehydrogenase
MAAVQEQQDQPSSAGVVVIGGGIVGWSVASALARRGDDVVVIEAGSPTFGTSSANAGHLVPSHRIPFASPGMVRSGLRSLYRRDGAFAISPKSAPHLLPWLVRFAASTTDANVQRGAPALTSLLDITISEARRLHAAGYDFDFLQRGLVQVFTSQQGLAGGRHEAEHMREFGVPISELSGDEVRDQEPVLRTEVCGALVLEDDARMDPAKLLAAVRSDAEAHGARVVASSVSTVTGGAGAGIVVSCTRDSIRADRVVVAAGVWTRALARSLGHHLPLMPAKGYSVTIDVGDLAPSRPMVLMDQRVALAPLSRGLRLACRYELTSPTDRGIPPRRIAQLLHNAGIALRLPADVQPANEWTGLRPALPDGVPAIGRLGERREVYVATGHGMLGTAAGLGTGEVLAALMHGDAVDFDPATISPMRFRRWRPR